MSNVVLATLVIETNEDGEENLVVQYGADFLDLDIDERMEWLSTAVSTLDDEWEAAIDFVEDAELEADEDSEEETEE